MRKEALVAMLAGLSILVAACGRTPEDRGEVSRGEDKTVTLVYVVNYPLAYFAERIGGDRVDVSRQNVCGNRGPSVWY